MKITILGSGDAFGSGGRYATCLHLALDTGANLLVDCGATSLLALNRAGIDRNAISAILFTHFHGDHFGGLPFFLLDALFVSRRTEPLMIAGPRGVEERARIVTEAAFPGFSSNRWPFEIVWREIMPDAPGEVAGAAVTAFAMVHDERAGPCLGYRIAADGKVFAFSGDTSWTDSLLPLADGADLLLCECYTFDMPLKNHLDWRTLSARLPDLRAARIVLTHMGPQMLERRGEATVACAEDGMVLTP